MLIRLMSLRGSKPSTCYFNRDYCGANYYQKVPKFFELFREKKGSRTT